MRDPYSVLGIAKTAGSREIKTAYRKLAKRYHPDRNKGDPGAKDRFAEVNRAYEILGDKEKRAQYDRGEIDAEGKSKFAGFEGFGGGAPFGGFEFGTTGRRTGSGSGPDDLGSAEEILKEFFGSAFGNTVRNAGFQGGARRETGFGGSARTGGSGNRDLDTRLTAKITVEDMARGKAMVTLPDGKKLSFSVPPGATDGQAIRLAGQGRKSPGMKPGDAIITLKIAKHPRYSVDGSDLRTSEPLPLAMAVNGGKLGVETIDGNISLNIPPWTDGGRTFRLKGKGLPRKNGGHGDLLLTVYIELPKENRERLAELLGKRDLRNA